MQSSITNRPWEHLTLKADAQPKACSHPVPSSQAAIPLEKIAINAGSYDAGGIGTALLTLAQALSTRGNSVDLLSMSAGPMERATPQGVMHHVVGPKASKSVLGLARYFRREKPDTVLVARDYVGVVTALALRLSGRRAQTTLIWTFHTFMSKDAEVSKFYKRAIMRLARGAIRRSDILIGVSQGVSREAERFHRLPSGRVITVPNAVWTAERLAVAQPDLIENNGRKHIVCCARLEPQKDLSTLLKAIKQLSVEMDCELYIAGDGSERSKLDSQVKDLGLAGRVHFLGQVDECLQLIKSADCLVLTSTYEGAPVILIEALIVGLPIVSTDCPAGPREILDDGALGRLVSVGNVTEIAQALGAALTQNHSKSVRAAQHSKAKEYLAETVAQRYETLIAQARTK